MTNINATADTMVTEVPNGDLSKVITAFNGVRKGIYARTKDSADGAVSITDMAMFIAAARVLTDKLEHYTDLYTKALKDAGVAKYDFEELGRTVAITKGRALSKIDNEAFSLMTLDEIKAAATLTEKGLKEIKRSDLIDKYRVVTGESSPAIQVKLLK